MIRILVQREQEAESQSGFLYEPLLCFLETNCLRGATASPRSRHEQHVVVPVEVPHAHGLAALVDHESQDTRRE